MRSLTAVLVLIWLMEAAAWQSTRRQFSVATILVSSFRPSSSSRAPSSGAARDYSSFLIHRSTLFRTAATPKSPFSTSIDDFDDEFFDPNLGPGVPSSSNNRNSNPDYYCRYWDALLTAEHAEAVEDLRKRRRVWSSRRLQASGLALLDCRCEADSAIINDKIVRITTSSPTPIRFTRGEIVLITPTAVAGAGFRTSSVQQLHPREGCIVDVSRDWMTVAIGPTWLPGLYESRKQQSSRGFTTRGACYTVRVDKAAPRSALVAQRSALELVRKGQAGVACDLLVQSFGKRSMQVDHVRLAEPPNRFQGIAVKVRQGILARTLDQATTNSDASFQPNDSQRDAIVWALGRRVSLLQGPPGTGKTRTLALLVATALQQARNDPATEATKPVSPNTEHSSNNTATQCSNNSSSDRILAVAHSNGAADVLLQALLDLGIPAVRVGRPASVAASVRHRTVLALAERHPEMVALRQSRLETETSLNQNLQEICRFIERSAPVVVTSCIGAFQLLDHSNKRNNPQHPQFSLVVVDEAAQTTEPALLCALAAAQAEQLVLVGDTQQLPPTVASQDTTLRAKLGVSPMERLEKLSLERRVFATQYRMPPALLEHPSRYFYDCRVTSAPRLKEAPLDIPLGFPWPTPDIPLAFVHCGSNLEVPHEFGGKTNPTEAKLVADIVAGLLHGQPTLSGSDSCAAVRNAQEDVAVISPYSKQVQLIQNELVKHNIWEVRVGTVDSFQGQETAIVCISAVRSNTIHELGFLRDPRRLCVSLTRQRGLVVVGDADTLNGCRHWGAFIESCRSRHCVLNSNEYYTAVSMRRAIVAKNQPMAKVDSSLPCDQASVENTTEKYVFEGISLFD